MPCSSPSSPLHPSVPEYPPLVEVLAPQCPVTLRITGPSSPQMKPRGSWYPLPSDTDRRNNTWTLVRSKFHDITKDSSVPKKERTQFTKQSRCSGSTLPRIPRRIATEPIGWTCRCFSLIGKSQRDRPSSPRNFKSLRLPQIPTEDWEIRENVAPFCLRT